MKKILIISNPQDKHLAPVSEAIKALGADPVFFYPENLGDETFLIINQTDEDAVRIMLRDTGGVVHIRDIYAVWYRRPRPFYVSKELMTSEGLEFTQDEWRAALEAMYVLMDRLFWVSHPDKLLQAAR